MTKKDLRLQMATGGWFRCCFECNKLNFISLLFISFGHCAAVAAAAAVVSTAHKRNKI